MSKNNHQSIINYNSRRNTTTALQSHPPLTFDEA